MMQVSPLTELMRSVGVPPKDGSWIGQAAMLRQHSVKVDLVAEHERVWIKIIARNAKAFRHEMAGLELWGDDDSDKENDETGLLGDDDDSSSNSDSSDNEEDGHRHGLRAAKTPSMEDLPIFKRARHYLRAAHAHRVHFKEPIVMFAFLRIRRDEDPFVQRIMPKLEEMGICVYMQGDPGGIQGAYKAPIQRIFPLDDTRSTTPHLNLDVSTVLAMISELSHHVCSPDHIQGEPLKNQAIAEASAPVLAPLARILQGKKLFMTQCAFERLRDIMSLVAGPRERQRYQQLFPNPGQKIYNTTDTRDAPIKGLDDNDDMWTRLGHPPTITIIPNDPTPRFLGLLEGAGNSKYVNSGRKIRTRFTDYHATIFGTGDKLQMTTVTAIQWMDHALTKAGITDTLLVVHDARSLAEEKMNAA
ncbi:hypothetical protein BC940DRAFT_119934 [Gongronella butleri]|nr:hypothetical protein BC940DRAFT_119934 [Gongronella butleri]